MVSLIEVRQVNSGWGGPDLARLTSTIWPTLKRCQSSTYAELTKTNSCKNVSKAEPKCTHLFKLCVLEKIHQV